MNHLFFELVPIFRLVSIFFIGGGGRESERVGRRIEMIAI
jgi:hypothetical protein